MGQVPTFAERAPILQGAGCLYNRLLEDRFRERILSATTSHLSAAKKQHPVPLSSMYSVRMINVLVDFVDNNTRMSCIYQPVMLTVLGRGGSREGAA